MPPLLAVTLAVALGAPLTSARAEEAPGANNAAPAPATTPAPGTPNATPVPARQLPAPALPALAWLEGCWQGSVNKREFREVWLPQRGGMMVGVSQTVMDDKTIDYEYLRIETRGDGVYYVVSPPGKPEEAFRLSAENVDAEDAHTFQFTDAAREFPSRIGYRRASEGWLYTEVEGKVKGTPRRVIYPMRRISCETGQIQTGEIKTGDRVTADTVKTDSVKK